MPATGTSFLVSIAPVATSFLAGSGPGLATAFVVSSQPTATSWVVEGGGAVATSFIVSRLPTATAFVVGEVADAVLDYTVDLRTCGTLTVTYPDNPVTSELLVLEVKDLETGKVLPNTGGLDTATDTWRWTLTSLANQVLQLTLSGGSEGVLSTPVLVNCRALKVVTKLLKKGSCDCHAPLLQQLQDYNALAVLLFQAKDYATAAAYLHLLDDLAPCGCNC